MGDFPLYAQAAELKFQIQLVWATDDAKPPAGKDYKPVEPAVRRQIKALKWKNYFEVKRIDFTVPTGAIKKVAISEKCELDVKDLGNSNVEVVLFGKGKEVARVKQALRKGEILVPGGDAPNETAWLAILKRMD
jgi:acylphosphatase